MKEENRRITNYLRKAVLAQVDKAIDFKNEEFYKISKESFVTGNIDAEITSKLFENDKKEFQKGDEKNIDENLYVMIAAKVIRTEVEGSQKKDEDMEDLTGIFYIPALLNKKSSSLLPAIEDNKLPWFPRELLRPMIEPELAIGDSKKYDRVVSDEIYNIYKIVSWKDYLLYCKNIYETTTGCFFEKDEISNLNDKNEKIALEKNVYIFLDKTINPTYHIKKLYNSIVKQDIEMPLYENFISLTEKENKNLIENTSQNRKMHYGQMEGRYELSKSQRESINHFNNIENGEILAIQGPPGTGKTTLLKSIIATKYVQNAIEGKKPEIIVATSTNNQAVTNIIESFSKVTSKYKSNLETRWIENVNSFAMYFPSKQKIRVAKQQGYQYTSNKGEYTLAEIDNEENIEASTKKFLKQAQELFPIANEEKTISGYKKKIHEKLLFINKTQNHLIDIIDELEKIIGTDEITEFISKKERHLQELDTEKKQILERMDFWKDKYEKVPKIWKIFSFIKKYKTKISNSLKLVMSEDEEFEDDIVTIDIIENYYVNKVQSINKLIQETKGILEKVKICQLNYNDELDNLHECGIDLSRIREIPSKDELDKWLDKNTRYISFWLAVHYYEARWLEKECMLTDKQKGTNYENVLKNFYQRLSLITPCMVMTFYMLPRQFTIYSDEDNKDFLYNFIDILIVDEAGQVSTEIGACSFALAKKSIVVGDENQIKPVWGIDRPLDKSLAIQEKIINNEKEFEKLETCGITSSNSSVMKVACKSCSYSKYGDKGLFLSEHRRCFNEIIDYCNELVYKNKLKPLREENYQPILPKFGYHLIETKKSIKVGTSRINTIEATGIARWILENEKEIFEFYSNNNVKKENILGIVTPFKEQVQEIKRTFKEILPKDLNNLITIGTVHTFQGGERKIIILSTTYGRDDGCFFIDSNKNIMNVAVSRAEDSFLVFGDINCLKDEEKNPSGLLKKYIINNCI